MTAQTLEILERAEFSPKQSRLIAEAIEVEVRAQNGDSRTWIESRFDTMSSHFDDKLAAFDDKFAAFDVKLAAFDDKLAALESKIDGKLAALESKIDGKLAALESRMDGKLLALESAVGAKIAVAHADIIKWMFIFIIGQTTILFGGMVFLLRLLIKT